MALDLRNIDCMKLMAEYPDKHFDLAIVDPPYGIGIGNERGHISPQKGNGNRRRLSWKSDWDNQIPDGNYFNELKRVSRHQIIWGGNYFFHFLSQTRCCIVWDKMQEFDGSDFELAWTSFEYGCKIFRYARCMVNHYPNGDKKIHPTQKPTDLYKWILSKFAKPEWKILDTHLGSGSIAIACHDYKFDLVASEIDKEYYDATMKRVSNHLAQTVLF